MSNFRSDEDYEEFLKDYEEFIENYDEYFDQEELVLDGPIVTVTITEIVDFDDKVPPMLKEKIDEYVDKLGKYLLGDEIDLALEVHENFKVIMDEYEEFFDIYIESDADDDIGFFEGVSLVSRFAEVADNFLKIDTADLSDDEYLYYLITLGRIAYKLDRAEDEKNAEEVMEEEETE